MSADPMRRHLDALGALAAEMDAEEAASRDRDAAAERRVAEQARAGAFGPERQRLQRQLDRGRTTMAEVLSGEDASPEAESFRASLRLGLAEARRRWIAQDEADGRTDPAEEFAAVPSRIAEQARRIRQEWEERA